MRLLTQTDLQQRLQLRRSDIQSMLKQGLIPSVRLPVGGVRFDERQITQWIESLKHRTQTQG